MCAATKGLKMYTWSCSYIHTAIGLYCSVGNELVHTAATGVLRGIGLYCSVGNELVHTGSHGRPQGYWVVL